MWRRVLLVLAVTLVAASRMDSLQIQSPELTSFWHEKVTIGVDVLLPDGYDSDATKVYPVIYWFPGFDGNYDRVAREAWGNWVRAMAATDHPAIVVFPNPVFDGVYTEFANSANTGPWDTAFVQDVHAYVLQHYRIQGSYLAGLSSGGWAALWLQTTNPQLFDGAYGYAPDPVSFADFTGPNLTTTPPQNFYRSERGEYRITRIDGRDTQTLRELIIGDQGSFGPRQFFSFEAVFSPATQNGPAPLFDRKTGDVDATVAQYWETHYDMTTLLAQEPPALRERLDGRLHLIVGTQDTFHLDGPARIFCSTLRNVVHPQCTFVPGADHWGSLREDGPYENHLLRSIYSGGVSPK